MNRSPEALLAMSARCCRVKYLSLVRVYTTVTLSVPFSMSLPNFLATDRLMSFSFEIRPMAPVSRPPCPASITTTKFRAHDCRGAKSSIAKANNAVILRDSRIVVLFVQIYENIGDLLPIQAIFANVVTINAVFGQ